MTELTDEQAAQLKAGAGACVTSIAVAASIGGLFGGAGAVIGAIAASLGPSCLAVL